VKQSSKLNDSIALSDKEGSVYKKYNVKNNIRMALYGGVEFARHFKRYRQHTNIGAIIDDARQPAQSLQLPADFLIDEDGVVVDLFRAQRKQQSMPMERIEQFVPKDLRCKCNGKGCVFPSCRKEYESIRESCQVFMG